jgi:hypothetical protein
MPDHQQLRHEREQIDAAARTLRSRAIADAYAGDGHERKHVAFSLALILDEISRHLGQVSDVARRAALECSAVLEGGSRRP